METIRQLVVRFTFRGPSGRSGCRVSVMDGTGVNILGDTAALYFAISLPLTHTVETYKHIYSSAFSLFLSLSLSLLLLIVEILVAPTFTDNPHGGEGVGWGGVKERERERERETERVKTR